MNSFYFLLSLMILDCCLAENEYYTYDRIDSTLHAWQDTFGYTPHSSNHYSNYNFGIIYNLDTIGYSSQDSLPIYAVKLSSHADKREAEPRVLILGQCHAEEIYGVEISMEIINQFLHPDQYTINRPHMQIGLKFTELWIIPTPNPEGLRVVHGYFENGTEIKDVTYRKNKWDTNNNGIFDYIPGVGQDIDGVDLNRNYNFNWIFGDTLLSPGFSCNSAYFDDYDYYRGSYPESESEIQAIMDWTSKQQFLLSMAYHSSRSVCIDRYVIYPWAGNDKWEEDVREYSPGFNVIEKLGVEIAEIAGMDRGSNYGHTGTSYRKGNAQDWLYRETGCIQYLVEVGYTPDHQYDGGLLVEEDHLEEVIESNLNAFFHLLMRAAGGRSYTNVLGESADGNQVTGIVSDAITGIPIEGAYVRIDELEEGNILRPRKTDSLGYFCRLLYPNETYTLVVSAHGYTTSDTINIIHSTSGPTSKNIKLIPSPRYELTFNMQLPNNDNTDVQLIINNIFLSDTVNIIHGESINLPQNHYQLIISSSDYIPQVFDIDIRVHPDFQGKGYGKTAYSYLTKELKKFDPIKLFSYAHEPNKRSIRFLEERGFKIKNKEKQSSLDLIKYNPTDFTGTIERTINNNIRIINLIEFRSEDFDSDSKIWGFDSLVSPDMPFSEPIEVPTFEVYCKQTFKHPSFNPESWFIALDGKKIVGVSNLWKRKGNVGINTGFSGVHKDYRCMGIASSLKHTALKWAKKKQYPWVRTENDSTNKGMLGINIKAGFKPMPSWLFMTKIIKK